MIIKKFSQAIQLIQSLTKQEFQQYLAVALASVGILSLGATYYVYHKSYSLRKDIQKLNTQTNKIEELIAKNVKLSQEEEIIRKILDENPDFNMFQYFEKFRTRHNIKPEPGWKPEDGEEIIGSEPGIKYKEVILRATFKNQTMEKLVSVLQDIYKEQIVYLKSLEIAAQDSKISFELELATKQYKKEAEE